MVRTASERNSAYTKKAIVSKTRNSSGVTTSSSSYRGAAGGSGGGGSAIGGKARCGAMLNPFILREKPEWQKGIKQFFQLDNDAIQAAWEKDKDMRQSSKSAEENLESKSNGSTEEVCIMEFDSNDVVVKQVTPLSSGRKKINKFYCNNDDETICKDKEDKENAGVVYDDGMLDNVDNDSPPSKVARRRVVIVSDSE